MGASSFSSLFVSSPPSPFFLHLGEQHAAAAASPSSLIFHPKKEIVLFLFRGSAYFSPKKGRERQKKEGEGRRRMAAASLSASILAQLASQPLSLLFLLLCSPSPLLSFSSRSLINLIFRSFFPGKFSYYRTAAVRPCPGGPFVIIAQEEAVPHSRTFIYEEKKKRIPFARGHLRRLPLKVKVDYDAKRQYQNYFLGGKTCDPDFIILALVCVGDPAALPKIKLELLRQKNEGGGEMAVGVGCMGGKVPFGRP